jgi:hypothetical protein
MIEIFGVSACEGHINENINIEYNKLGGLWTKHEVDRLFLFYLY